MFLEVTSNVVKSGTSRRELFVLYDFGRFENLWILLSRTMFMSFVMALKKNMRLQGCRNGIWKNILEIRVSPVFLRENHFSLLNKCRMQCSRIKKLIKMIEKLGSCQTLWPSMLRQSFAKLKRDPYANLRSTFTSFREKVCWKNLHGQITSEYSFMQRWILN